MTGKHIVSFCFVILFSAKIFSQSLQVAISGNTIGYAGKELIFYIVSESIFEETKTLGTAKVDSTGSFSISFPLNKTQCVYCLTPLYKAFIFTEPGKSYHVKLPPLPSNNTENINNPFFIAPSWHMIPETDSGNETIELNTAINTFNEQFEPFLDKQILRYYDPHQSQEKLDSFILASSKLPSPPDNEYYRIYTNYKFACLGFIVNQFSRSDLFAKYLKNSPVYPEVPSWWEFFNLYFDGYFGSLIAGKDYGNLYSLIGKGSYYSLNQVLKKDSALQNDQVREWVILKEIHNAYFQGSLTLETVNSICDSLSARSKDKISISMAEVLKSEASTLLPGDLPPSEILVNGNGDTLEIGSMHGKYTYIGFCSLDNLGCQKEFEYLKYLISKHAKYLELLIILPPSEKDRISSYTEENTIPWTFWYCPDNNKIVKDYRVKAFPLFYLLDREGKLLNSPATLPSAGFEQQLFRILKNRGEI